jgi:dynein regulatry complex protein 1
MAPMARILRHAAQHNDVVDGKTTKNITTGSSSSATANKAKMKRADQEYWRAVVCVVPPRSVRVMTSLEKGLTSYHQALLKRKELIDEVGALKQQNTELKNLLKKYLAAPINEDLLVPPTQMQLYQ